MTIIYFILILGVVVFVHELGHFIFAKRAGIYVYEFALGMGPRIFKFKRKNDETEYSIRAFPIGGFVKMAGEEIEADENISADQRVQSKSWLARFLTMISGVIFNFILAIIIFIIMNLVLGVPVNNHAVVTRVSPYTWSATGLSSELGSPAFRAELENGDIIIRVNGTRTRSEERFMIEHHVNYGNKLELEVLRNNEIITVLIEPEKIDKGSYYYGFSLYTSTNNLVIEVTDPARDAGLEVNDILVGINGVETPTIDLFLNEYSDNYGEELELRVLRNNEIITISIEPEELENDIYRYGIGLDGSVNRSFFGSIRYGFVRFANLMEQMLVVITYLITGNLSLNSLAGPIGIFNVVGESAQLGFINVVFLLGFISLNVGFINLLPFPAFDGGRILFLIVEAIRRKPLKPEIENRIHFIGFVLLMVLMVVITYNDIMRFIIGR